MNLCLGTVQLGMDYGILNTKRPAIADSLKWLDYATQNGVEAIDTAKAYGIAEEIVGSFLNQHTIPREKLFISTKLLPNILDDINPEDYTSIIEKEIVSQLKVLHTDYVDAYIFHSSRYSHDKEKLEALRSVVKKGYARKCGVSVYEPQEAFDCLESGMVDFIQAPYSIFDHRMKNSGVFERSLGLNCDIHTRSAFIQGLITLREDQVPSYLEKAKPIINRIDLLCKREGIKRTHLALQYVKRENAISHLVFGVDSLDQLKENMTDFYSDIPGDLLDRIGKEFDSIEAEIVMPSLWKKD